MRGHLRDQKKLWYRLSAGLAATYDLSGYQNGVKQTFSAAVAFTGNLDDGTGEVGREIFGKIPDYTHVLIVFDKACPIAEDSVINLTAPTTTTQAYDFTVRARHEGLNTIMFALKRVKTSGA